MITIIAEKPSVALAIAQVKNATVRHDGYLSDENREVCVTWAFGHLIQLAMPQEYGFKRKKAECLPFIPETFRLIRRQIKTKDGYKTDEGVIKQLEIIQQLFNNSDLIVNATDAGREGELIFRYIYQYLNCHKPFSRLWINSLTDKAIREGLQNLQPGSQYENLFLAAMSRSEADWLIGMNASQALTIAARKGIFSLGRVQTPTLAMVCTRFLDNRNFKPTPYWQIRLYAEKLGVEFSILSDKYNDEQAASADLARVKADGQLSIINTERKEVTQAPPLPYDLTNLQKDANVKFDFSAEKTLQIAQKLYEMRLITYPRTGSRYLPEDVFSELPKLILNLEQYPVFAEYARSMKGKKLNRKAVDNSKVTDHHALLVTETNIPPMLAEDDARIYNLIAGRMLESVSENCLKEEMTVHLKAAGIAFRINGCVIKQKGWKTVFNNAGTKEENEENVILPVLTAGESLPLKNAESIQKQTKPQPLLTEATLLARMETAGKELADEAEREAIKECGIGTPATRAGIIEVLFHREYIRKEKKSLVPTDKGLAVYNIVQPMKIADVQMTASWEKELADIEAGNASATEFHQNIIGLTHQITKELLSAKVEVQDNTPHCLCPKCRSKLLFFNKVVKCPNEKCGLVLFKNKGEKQLCNEQMAELLIKKKTPLIKGFKNKDKKSFDAFLVLDEDYNIRYEFPPKQKKKV